MRKKRCTKCNLTSFSAYSDEWICPYCSEDISEVQDHSINYNSDIIKAGENKNGDKTFIQQNLWN
ncbi:MAG: hypothetical protein ACOY46_17025 [Bacillota bacterium]